MHILRNGKVHIYENLLLMVIPTMGTVSKSQWKLSSTRALTIHPMQIFWIYHWIGKYNLKNTFKIL